MDDVPVICVRSTARIEKCSSRQRADDYVTKPFGMQNSRLAEGGIAALGGPRPSRRPLH